MKARLFVLLQYVLPQHGLSRVVLLATRVRTAWLKNLLITAFVRHFKPEMQEAGQPDPLAYASFNDFFTRALRDHARPMPADPLAIASPVDGTVSAIGHIDGARLLQAKSHHYSLEALLAGAAPWPTRFMDGEFATIYLAPFNYHRVHMPCDGTLTDAWYVPGRLFSVNEVTAAAVPRLFARNERVVLLFEGAVGAFAVVLVGALNVGSMATVWHGDVTPRRPRHVTRLDIPAGGERAAFLARGAELGRFNMGSTVIVLWARGRVRLTAALSAGQRVRLGEQIGRVA